MEVHRLKIIMRFLIVGIMMIILVNLIRAKLIVKISAVTNVGFYNVAYEDVEVSTENNSYKKPEFKYNDELNQIVNEYIENNSCENLEYSVYKIGSDKVNIYLNCGKPQSVLYDYVKKEKLGFETVVKNSEDFDSNVKRLLNLKYPTFVTDEISTLNGAYNIKDNEIVAYYDTVDYGSASIKINNNEIKNDLVYNMSYDDAYENETYTLDKNKKTIAFTFDDGPSTYDLEIIDTLVASHSKATFFVVGNRINNYTSSIQKMLDNGMEVGNHTYDHKSMTKLSTEAMREEIVKTNETFKALTGQELKLFRPSYGSINKTVLLTIGMPSILWSIDTLDWQSRDVDKICEAILKDVSDGDIVLMHSLYKTTSEAVKKVIPELYKRGYQIVTVSELMELKGITLSAGSSYRNAK